MYKADQYGIMIRLSADRVESVELLLRAAFGEPFMRPRATVTGGRLGAYRLTEKGGVIQFMSDQSHTYVWIVRPLTQAESEAASKKALQVLGLDRYWAEPPNTVTRGNSSHATSPDR